MPVYNEALLMQALYPGQTIALFNAEAVTTGEKSLPVHLPADPRRPNNPVGLTLQFSAAPGAFTINCQFSEVAADAAYALPLPLSTYQITAANLDAASGVSVHVDLPTNAAFFRLYVAAQPANGAVLLTATAKR